LYTAAQGKQVCRQDIQENNMFYRPSLGALLLTVAVLPVVSCSTSPSLTSITISPNSYTTTLVLTASGAVAPTSEQGQTLFTATGYYTHPGHPAETKDLTNEVNWLSYTPEVVTVATNGVATVTGAAIGTTQVTASMAGFNGDVVSPPASFTVTLPSTAKGSDVISLVVAPTNPLVTAGQSIDFTAIGTTGNGGTESLTTQSSWTSSNVSVCAINAGNGQCGTTASGTSVITATYNNLDGIPVAGYTTLTVQ
jgi:hypothetical protein